MELVVRLHRHFGELDEPYRMEFVPDAVVWTEAPESRQVLGRQRSRWYRGLLESLELHRGMIDGRKYGATGYLLVPVMFVLGFLNVPFFTLFIAVAVGLGTLMS